MVSFAEPPSLEEMTMATILKLKQIAETVRIFHLEGVVLNTV